MLRVKHDLMFSEAHKHNQANVDYSCEWKSLSEYSLPLDGIFFFYNYSIMY